MEFSNDSILLKLKEDLEKIHQKRGDLFYGWKISISDSRSLQSLMLGTPEHGFSSYSDRDVIDRAYAIEVFTRTGTLTDGVMGNSTYNIDPLTSLEEQINKAIDNALQVSNRPWDLPTPVGCGWPYILWEDINCG